MPRLDKLELALGPLRKGHLEPYQFIELGEMTMDAVSDRRIQQKYDLDWHNTDVGPFVSWQRDANRFSLHDRLEEPYTFTAIEESQAGIICDVYMFGDTDILTTGLVRVIHDYNTEERTISAYSRLAREGGVLRRDKTGIKKLRLPINARTAFRNSMLTIATKH